MEIRTLSEAEIRSLIDPADALAAVRTAFAAFADGRATLPGVIGMEFHDHNGEAHIKGAYLHGEPYWSIKAATGFYDNPALGLPMLGGLSLVFSATTGLLDTLLLDNGYLTELRTGAAGGAGRRSPCQTRDRTGADRRRRRSGSIPAGSAARGAPAAAGHCLRAACGGGGGLRHGDGDRLGVEIAVAPELREAVAASDLIVTATPARSPLIEAAWLRPGVHITAMGSDFPDKQELAAEVLARADLVVADHPPQAATQGEVHHAIAAGCLRLEDVSSLGSIAAGKAAGRARDDQITVADLTGLGIQDAALANAVVTLAKQRGLGQVLR